MREREVTKSPLTQFPYHSASTQTHTEKEN